MIKVFKKSWHRLVAALLTIAILASPGIMGFAAASTAKSSPIKQIPVITGKDAIQYENSLIKLADSQGISAEYQLNKDNILVQDLDAALGDGIISASIPIIDNTGVKRSSFFSALFNKKDGTLIQTMAFVYNKTGEIYEGTYLQNGAKIFCLTIQKNGEIISGYKVNPDGTTTNFTPEETVNLHMSAKNVFWDCWRNCLLSQGVPAFLVGMVGATCTLVCIDLPNPPGCVICAAAVLIGFEGIAGYCMYQCW
ncbi:MAG: hypothetical protein CVU90_15815 [Firmicutes bacterium HGW-Firmicutes-15]|nr:MAG: hypothetical protein CVU90_15815 [Firmicutes bacterium HGW-Firmicutes-15]